jgi:uncharacterized protein YqgC (DUF456 family)
VIIFMVLLIMFCGLFFTVMPKIPGTLIIFLTLISYAALNNFDNLSWQGLLFLTLLVIIAEVFCPVLRRYLTEKYPLSRLFSVDSLAGNAGGMVTSSMLFGPVLGQAIWQVVAGKSWLAKWKWVSRIIARLFLVALIRFGIGLTMIFFGIFTILK